MVQIITGMVFFITKALISAAYRVTLQKNRDMNETTATTRRQPCVSGGIGAATWTAGHPLPVDGCLIMLCEGGSAAISVNSRTHTMSRGMMALLAFDMVVVPLEISDGFSARFLSLDFDTAQDIFFLVTSNRFWDFVYTTPVFTLPPSLLTAASYWFAIIGRISTDYSAALRDRMMRNEAENFMLAMAEQTETRLGRLGLSPPKNRAWALTNSFIALLNRHYAAHHDVAFYAERLNVTPNYLNIIIRRNTGTTAKEQINKQIVLTIKMLLDTTDLSVKQIAGRLHYDDPSYLCRIFRKHTGMSPMHYRERSRPPQG